MGRQVRRRRPQHRGPLVDDRLAGVALLGVAAGIAERTGVSVFLVRLGFVVATFFAGFGALVYLAGWILLPNEGEDLSPAERWRANLATPGRRAGAFFVGIAGLLLIAATAPVAAFAAIAILLAAALLPQHIAPAAEVPPAEPTAEADEAR